MHQTVGLDPGNEQRREEEDTSRRLWKERPGVADDPRARIAPNVCMMDSRVLPLIYDTVLDRRWFFYLIELISKH